MINHRAFMYFFFALTSCWQPSRYLSFKRDTVTHESSSSFLGKGNVVFYEFLCETINYKTSHRKTLKILKRVKNKKMCASSFFWRKGKLWIIEKPKVLFSYMDLMSPFGLFIGCYRHGEVVEAESDLCVEFFVYLKPKKYMKQSSRRLVKKI